MDPNKLSQLHQKLQECNVITTDTLVSIIRDIWTEYRESSKAINYVFDNYIILLYDINLKYRFAHVTFTILHRVKS